jgi:hypothetical protein
MSLFGFIDDKTSLGDKYKKYLALKDKLVKEGMPANLAEYKASELLTPDKLEKIKIAVDNNEGRRLGIEIFVDTEEELKLLAKYFHLNPHVMQIRDVKLLLKLLQMMENLPEQGKKNEGQ